MWLALCLSLAGVVPARADSPQASPAEPTGAAPRVEPAALPALPPVRPLPPAAPGVRTTAEATIGAVGDVLMHAAVKETAAAHGGDYGFLWAPVADLLRSNDLTFANLETPVAPRTGTGARSFVFNAPPAAVRALGAAGVKLVSVANNHIFDQGRDGFLETVAELDRLGMPFVGAGPAPHEAGPRLVELNGLRVAFLGFAQFFNQSGNDCPARREGPCVKASLLDPERAVAAVREAAARSDAVVVSIHWGVEYTGQPREAEVALAHRLADAGALVVLGHHPHVLQPLELYRREDGRVAAIAYSLGNFVSNQSRNFVPGVTPDAVAAPREGALLRVRLARRDYGRGVELVELAGVDYVPLWTENDTVELDRKRHPEARPTIRVVALDRALAEVRAELARFPEPLPAPERPAWVKLRRREAAYAARRAEILATLGEELAREVAPPPPESAAATR
ncbi:CapA family protein [Anaeromyxobacter paludicola]|uniref:CapA family protein n=1 Tax=Anaeromyxobacter paludicola TaxID=2918171 RepID=UPI0020C07617|nr:CapA family protein [Anaeromyxobacter paludicola]